MAQDFQSETYVVSLGGEKRINSATKAMPRIPSTDGIRDRTRGSTIMVTLDNPRWFVDEWDIIDSLGAPGAFGIAYSCKRKNSNDDVLYAVKQINKARFYHIGKEARKDILEHIKNEINIQTRLNHPNIAQLYEVYEDRNFLYLVMDYLSGGELFDRICSKGSLTEKEAAHITKQILDALDYMQMHDVAHLDLKPDNILFERRDEDSPIKVIDFGMAQVVPRMKKLKQLVGTLYYTAPEVLNGEYDRAADVWSVGVILFCMLFGFPPFYVDGECLRVGQSEEDAVIEAIQKGFDPTTKPGYGAWFPEDSQVSNYAKDLISKMLVKSIKDRPTVAECLSHPWIRGEADYHAIPRTVIQSLVNFQNTCEFKQIVARIFAAHMDPHRYAQTMETFRKWDKDGNGEISLEEFREGMKATTKLDIDEIDRIFKNLDADDGRSITIDELIISSAFDALVAVDERLYDMFVELDENGDGKVDSKEFKKKMENFGMNDIDIQRVELILREIDENGDGTIDYEEFLHALHPTMNELGVTNIVKTRSHGFTLNAHMYDNFVKKSELIKYHFDNNFLLHTLHSYQEQKRISADLRDNSIAVVPMTETVRIPSNKVNHASSKNNSNTMNNNSETNQKEEPITLCHQNSNSDSCAIVILKSDISLPTQSNQTQNGYRLKNQSQRINNQTTIKSINNELIRKTTYDDATNETETFSRNHMRRKTVSEEKSATEDDLLYVPPAGQCCILM